MSVAMSTRVWKHGKAKRGARLVLLALADFANDHGEAWPSLGTLAIKTRLSDRDVRYALRRLEHAGEIKTLRNQGPHGSNLYQITITEGEDADVATSGGNSCPQTARNHQRTVTLCRAAFG
jgi:hypothetical protein